jgi:hypothetical protein
VLTGAATAAGFIIASFKDCRRPTCYDNKSLIFKNKAF